MSINQEELMGPTADLEVCGQPERRELLLGVFARRAATEQYSSLIAGTRGIDPNPFYDKYEKWTQEVAGLKPSIEEYASFQTKITECLSELMKFKPTS